MDEDATLLDSHAFIYGYEVNIGVEPGVHQTNISYPKVHQSFEKVPSEQDGECTHVMHGRRQEGGGGNVTNTKISTGGSKGQPLLVVG